MDGEQDKERKHRLCREEHKSFLRGDVICPLIGAPLMDAPRAAKIARPRRLIEFGGAKTRHNSVTSLGRGKEFLGQMSRVRIMSRVLIDFLLFFSFFFSLVFLLFLFSVLVLFCSIFLVSLFSVFQLFSG